MTIGVGFYNRDFSEYTGRHWDSIEVNRYSQSAIGGPLQASFDVYGSEEDIWKFIEMLRCPVNLIDQERAQIVWWGYISKVDIYSTSGIKYGVSLDKMSNKLAVAYTYNFERETTGWATDTDSATEYGTKEIMLSTNDKTAGQALQYRNVELDVRKYPSRLPIQFASRRDTAMARIECLGWLSTIAWKYYANDGGKVVYENSGGSTKHGFGAGTFAEKAAQSFIINSTDAWDISYISVRLCYAGNNYEVTPAPTDAVQLTLRADAAGSGRNPYEPGALLKTANLIDASEITEYYDWYDFTLSTPYTITPGTRYWFQVERTGALDSENHYALGGTEEDTYEDGFAKVWMGNLETWNNPASFMINDYNFRIIGQLETTVMIQDIVDEAEFFTGSEILETTGVYSYPYRSGDSLALHELEELLKCGTASGNRLMVRVTPNRVLQVYEEPASGSADFFIDRNGLVTDQYNNDIHLASCPVAYWIQLKDIVPVSVDVSRLSNADRLFVEQSEYDAKTGVYKIKQARDSDIITDALAELKSPGINRRWQYEQG